MAGINLSQSLQEKEAQVKGTFFDTGLYINLGILALILMIFGGGRWYLSSLNQTLTGLDKEITMQMSQLTGTSVDRVADFRVRLDMIGESLKAVPQHTELFTQLEGKMVPNTKLTLYEESWVDGEVKLAGVTESLKYVAQEMLALKTIPRFKKVSVDALDYNDEGQLEFSLTLTTSQPGSLATP